MNELKYFKGRKNASDELSERIVQIKSDDIRPNRSQPRSDFNQNSIIRLADSIRRYGILQPLTVRHTDPDDSYGYELIAGERRLRAAKLLGYLTVPCIIKDTDEQSAAELAIIENLLREDLNMFEEAYGYKKLIENHRLTQEEVARRMSMSQSAVANKLRLLRLGYEEQLYILENGLTERHARAALRIDGTERRFAVIKHINEHKLTVSETEEYIENLLADKSTPEVEKVMTPSRKAPEEKELGHTVSAIRKNVDKWVNIGGNAEINVTNRSDRTEILVKLFK